jgi:hypothetical protein
LQNVVGSQQGFSVSFTGVKGRMLAARVFTILGWRVATLRSSTQLQCSVIVHRRLRAETDELSYESVRSPPKIDFEISSLLLDSWTAGQLKGQFYRAYGHFSIYHYIYYSKSDFREVLEFFGPLAVQLSKAIYLQ